MPLELDPVKLTLEKELSVSSGGHTLHMALRMYDNERATFIHFWTNKAQMMNQSSTRVVVLQERQEPKNLHQRFIQTIASTWDSNGTSAWVLPCTSPKQDKRDMDAEMRWHSFLQEQILGMARIRIPS